MPEITPLEAAEKLKEIAEREEWLDCENPNVEPLKLAATYLRKIASGDYVPVVHGRWAAEHRCNRCGKEPYRKSDRDMPKYCPSCGALMDGKDDTPCD